MQLSAKKAGFVFIITIIINLGLPGFYQYADFLIGTANDIMGLSVDLLHLKLSIGISFYTFQAMFYIIDVYRGNVKAENNIINFGYKSINKRIDSKEYTDVLILYSTADFATDNNIFKIVR